MLTNQANLLVAIVFPAKNSNKKPSTSQCLARPKQVKQNLCKPRLRCPHFRREEESSGERLHQFMGVHLATPHPSKSPEIRNPHPQKNIKQQVMYAEAGVLTSCSFTRHLVVCGGGHLGSTKEVATKEERTAKAFGARLAL